MLLYTSGGLGGANPLAPKGAKVAETPLGAHGHNFVIRAQNRVIESSPESSCFGPTHLTVPAFSRHSEGTGGLLGSRGVDLA